MRVGEQSQRAISTILPPGAAWWERLPVALGGRLGLRDTESAATVQVVTASDKADVAAGITRFHPAATALNFRCKIDVATDAVATAVPTAEIKARQETS